MRTLFLTVLFFWSATLASAQISGESINKSFSIGFFEGGSYPAHTEIRQQFRTQLEAMLPTGLTAVYVPQGFKTAEWDREKSRLMAAELAADRSVDIVVALGPWTVEDLLEAGFDRPIIAAYRFSPKLEGLLDSTNRPVAENLTVRFEPSRIESDLARLVQLTRPKRLALLFFPSGNEQAAILEEATRIGQRQGFEVITAEGYDREGSYAFFKAYGRLTPKADALYLGPLWGFDAAKMRQFYEMTARDRLPAFSSEGEYQALQGALVAGSGESLRVTARYAAWKAHRIMQGAVPADLPVTFPEQNGLTFNEAAGRHFGIPLGRRLGLGTQVVKTGPPTGAEMFTLTEAIDRALVQNPGYLARYDALESAAQAAGQAWSAYLPNLRAEGSLFYHDDNTVQNDDRFENKRYHAGLTLDQQILSLGAVRDIQLAANNRDMRGAELRQATLDLEYAVTVAFLNHVKATSVHDIRSAHRRIADECRQVAKAREQTKEGDHADVVRLEDEFLQTVRSLEAADHNLQVARILFNTLLGRPADMEFALEIGPLDASVVGGIDFLLGAMTEDPDLHQELREYLIAESRSHNPALEMKNLALVGQRTRLAGNTADFLPRIGFRASLNLVDERRPTEVFKEEHVTWSAGAKLELPLFWGTGRIKERKKLYAELSEMEYLKDDVSLEVAGKIDIQVNNLLSLTAQMYLSGSSARFAQEYVQLLIDDYTAGSRDISDLLESLANDRRARISAVVDRAGYSQAVAALVKELGWSVRDSGQSPDHMLLDRLKHLDPTGLLNR